MKAAFTISRKSFSLTRARWIANKCGSAGKLPENRRLRRKCLHPPRSSSTAGKAFEGKGLSLRSSCYAENIPPGKIFFPRFSVMSREVRSVRGGDGREVDSASPVNRGNGYLSAGVYPAKVAGIVLAISVKLYMWTKVGLTRPDRMCYAPIRFSVRCSRTGQFSGLQL